MKVSGKVVFSDQIKKDSPFSKLEATVNIIGPRQSGRTTLFEQMVRNTIHATRLLRFSKDVTYGGKEDGEEFRDTLKEFFLDLNLDGDRDPLSEGYLNRVNQLPIPPVVVLSPNLKMKYAAAAISPIVKDEAFLAIINPNFREVTILENNRVRVERYETFMEGRYKELNDVMLFLDGIQVGKWQGEGDKFMAYNNVKVITSTLTEGLEWTYSNILFKGDDSVLKGLENITYKDDGSRTFTFIKEETK